MITKTKVVTHNFIMDWVEKWRNMIGLNLKGYERMVEKGINQIKEEIDNENINLSWFRYEIAQLTNGALSITLYGEKK